VDDAGEEIQNQNITQKIRYNIDDAEEDVEDLRRMRRQIRCLFGAQNYPIDTRDSEGV
jgi:hypothetical protein